MTSSDKSVEQPFASDGGIQPPIVCDEDPYRTLDDLMAVVEALCPNWPERGVSWNRERCCCDELSAGGRSAGAHTVHGIPGAAAAQLASLS